MENPSHHRGMLTNALKANSSWKLACYVLGVVVLLLGWQMVKLKSAQAVTIAPYGLYSANKAVTVGDTLEESRDYIELLFRADLSTLLNWQAKTVNKQFETFMTRLSPEGYEKYNLDLRNKAVRYRDQNMTQVFHVSDISLLTGDTPNSFVMEAEGHLERKRASEPVIDTKIVYRISYSQKVTGLFQVDQVDSSYERVPARQASEG
jgi:hypothetical protein